MFSCLRRSDRRESDGMGHVCKEQIQVFGFILAKHWTKAGSCLKKTEEDQKLLFVS